MAGYIGVLVLAGAKISYLTDLISPSALPSNALDVASHITAVYVAHATLQAEEVVPALCPRASTFSLHYLTPNMRHVLSSPVF